jgi:phosphoribosylformylglycinamidine (FGAM) synthase PurS component
MPRKSLPGKIYKKNGDIVTRRIAGDLFLIPIRGKIAEMQNIFVLNPVSECIWQELNGQKCLDEIRKSVVAKFDVEEKRAESDIREFIAELLGADLIKEWSPTG